MLIITVPLFTTLLLPLLPRIIWGVSTMCLLVTCFISITIIYHPFPRPSIISTIMFSDPLSSSLASLSIWISALIFVARYTISLKAINPKKFVFLVNSLCLILVNSFVVTDFISFYIIFEASLIPTLLLVLGWGYQPERLQAGIYLILYTICARLPLLISLILIYKSWGSLYFVCINSQGVIFTPPLSMVWWLITIIAFLIKLPIFLFHLWLPKAHVEAPIAGSMILAGLLLKLGGYGLIRVSIIVPSLTIITRPLCNSVGLCGGVITRIICLRQTDIKSLIAYSSVGHMALVLVGVTLLSSWGWKGGITMIIAHGLCSSCLFALANLTYEATHTRSLFITKGILSLFPAISLWWIILSAINMAAPPSINLLAEISVILGAIWASPSYMLLLGLCSFLAAAYSLFIFTSTNHGEYPSFSNPLHILSPNLYTLMVLHVIPIFALISSPDLVAAWL